MGRSREELPIAEGSLLDEVNTKLQEKQMSVDHLNLNNYLSGSFVEKKSLNMLKNRFQPFPAIQSGTQSMVNKYNSKNVNSVAALTVFDRVRKSDHMSISDQESLS